MPTAQVNGIELAYDWHGPSQGPVMVLIQGLGMPLSAWPPELLELLTGQGFRVLVFDNRDIGRSQLIDAKVPRFFGQWLRAKLRLKVKAPYQLTDMMRDTVALLEALDIRRAHVVGISMGGMIAQLVAIHAPERVVSLVSWMSTTGNRALPGPQRHIIKHLFSRSASDADRVAFSIKTWQLIGSPAYPTAEPDIRLVVERILERGVTVAGVARQMYAIMAAPSRVAELEKLKVPTLVIHGNADPLVPVEGGRDTVRAIPGAKLEIIEGMGHDLPQQLTPRLAALIVSHARRSVAATPLFAR